MTASRLACSLTLLALLCFGKRGIAQPWNVGQSYFSPNGYIEYRPGNLPIILSAPHGGLDSPASIPNRTCNNPTLVVDSWTIELTRQTDSALYRVTGCRPHLIICHLKRSKMDANRDLADGACGNPDATVAWNAFHNWLDTARKIVAQQHGKGFYIDMHAHGHTVQQLELGYLLTAAQLRKTDTQLTAQNYGDSSSIKMLSYTNAGGQSFAQLLRGPDALGTLMASRGFPSVPSQQKPAPDTSEPYFNGGYNTAYYTSYLSGTIDGVQIETNFTGVRNTAANRRKFGDTLAVALIRFLKKHYFPGATFAGCATTGIAAVRIASPHAPYPNPSQGFFTFNAASGAVCEVVRLDGTPVMTAHERGGVITNSQRLSGGVYILRVRQSADGGAAYRLVVLPE